MDADHDFSDEELLRRASVYLGTTDRAKIVHEALKALCAREAGRRLARLGGTMPGLQAPPRRHFE
ncbi:MAG: type II toxin-antitoxin system VapB family antitoxin [Sphingomonadaceae bacterium]|nr:type II toxin-antitoxin system VapB family antitoxin [Sphingomonadaceae bacterium]